MGPAGEAFHSPQSPILSNPSTNPAVQFEFFNFLIGEILPPPPPPLAEGIYAPS